jgi:lipoate-protein ligase A
MRDGTLLHHATMSYDIDADKMIEVLRIGEAKISDKGVASAKKRVDPLRSQTGEARKDIIDVMADTFASRYGATYGTYTQAGARPGAGTRRREVRHGDSGRTACRERLRT